MILICLEYDLLHCNVGFSITYSWLRALCIGSYLNTGATRLHTLGVCCCQTRVLTETEVVTLNLQNTGIFVESSQVERFEILWYRHEDELGNLAVSVHACVPYYTIHTTDLHCIGNIWRNNKWISNHSRTTIFSPISNHTFPAWQSHWQVQVYQFKHTFLYFIY